ncbi:MAG: ATP-binding protein [Clostridia bacterium]|jgi:predicted AAA+ superfamily ATPase|nr:ATP-binding protein [Clostridia bacterium]
MERLLNEKLVEWKMSKTRKPLILKGVRQVGKTYLLKEFGNKYYEDVAYFNFEGNEALQSRFEQDLDPKRIIEELGVINKRVIKPGRTLIIFDEIQFCSKALTSLKYFYENLPEYHVACAGSLLGIALSKPLSFPVGKVDMMTLYPLNFEEFLLANDESMLVEALKKLKSEEKISALYEEKLMSYLNNYYITGGMPEVLNSWINNKDVEEVSVIQQKILDAYELDFAKHAPVNDYPKLSMIWKSIPEQLARENSKFVYGHVKSGARAKDLEDALEWLISAGMVYKITKIEKPYMPLSAYADSRSFKLYIHDVGLLRKKANLDAAIIYDDKKDIYKEFKGALAENFVLTELIAKTNETAHYWTSGNKAEVDFVKQFKSKIIPIEVKAGKNVTARSLRVYRDKYEPEISFKVSRLNIQKQDGTLNIPLYMVWNIEKYV